jgi:cardiolipin synthase
VFLLPEVSVQGTATAKRDEEEGEPSQLVLLAGGDSAFPQMLAAIGQARKSVYLEMYIFRWDGVGDEFVRALSAAARRGVCVGVVIDAFGSGCDGRKIAHALARAGCSVQRFNPFWSVFDGRFRRNHRKLLVVDDEVAFVGGINLDERYSSGPNRRGWEDLAFRVSGAAAARLSLRLRQRPGKPERGKLRVLLSGWAGGYRLRKRYLKAIEAARHRVLLAHGYFLPDREIAQALAAAALRGVHVDILLPALSDVPFASIASRRHYRLLLEAGVRIHEWDRSVLHVKAAVVDGKRLLSGSFNLDPFSLANLETLVDATEEYVAGQVENWILQRIRDSKPVSLATIRQGLKSWWLGVLSEAAYWVAVRIKRILAQG